MDTDKVQAEVSSIITSIKARGWKLTRTTKKALAEAEALGLTAYLGIYARADVKGAEIVNAVIDAAKDAGGRKIAESGFTVDGDGYADNYTTEPSALYLALNDTEPTPETHEEPQEYRMVRGDLSPYWYEWAIVDNGKVIASGTRALGDIDLWQDDNDPLSNDRVGLTKQALVTAGFDAPEAWRKWAIRWAKEMRL